jgi:hypothetical protein
MLNKIGFRKWLQLQDSNLRLHPDPRRVKTRKRAGRALVANETAASECAFNSFSKGAILPVDLQLLAVLHRLGFFFAVKRVINFQLLHDAIRRVAKIIVGDLNLERIFIDKHEIKILIKDRMGVGMLVHEEAVHGQRTDKDYT